MRTLRLEKVLALDLCRLLTSAHRCSYVLQITYGAAGDTVEALLALDVDIGAVRCSELYVEGS